MSDAPSGHATVLVPPSAAPQIKMDAAGPGTVSVLIGVALDDSGMLSGTAENIPAGATLKGRLQPGGGSSVTLTADGPFTLSSK